MRPRTRGSQVVAVLPRREIYDGFLRSKNGCAFETRIRGLALELRTREVLDRAALGNLCRAVDA